MRNREGTGRGRFEQICSIIYIGKSYPGRIVIVGFQGNAYINALQHNNGNYSKL